MAEISTRDSWVNSIFEKKFSAHEDLIQLPMVEKPWKFLNS
jgi:hypothetical protein